MTEYKRVKVGEKYRAAEVLEIYKGLNAHKKEAVMIKFYNHKWNETKVNAYNTFVISYVQRSHNTKL